MNHMPWDDGAITGIFGKMLDQKSVKSLCGKRVPFAAANSDATITCHQCAIKILERQASLEAIYKSVEGAMKSKTVRGYAVEYIGEGEDIIYKVMEDHTKIEVDHAELYTAIKEGKVELVGIRTKIFYNVK